MNEPPKDDGTAGFALMKAISGLIAAHKAVSEGAAPGILWGAQEQTARLLNAYVIDRIGREASAS